MPLDIVLGLQWGDEGKGKIVDLIGNDYDYVARFQGGPNAGHTLWIDGTKHVLHQVPSGIFRTQVTCVIGNGVIIDPVILRRELEQLLRTGTELDLHRRLLISDKAHLILPFHVAADRKAESAAANPIGSTQKGIAPAYRDKIGRTGLRTADLLKSDFDKKLAEIKALHLRTFPDTENADEMYDKYSEACEYIRSFRILSTELELNRALKNGKKVLAEGAQGTLLDIDFGAYPYVTGSNTTAGGACSGLGVSPKEVNKIIGVFKAYATRVGNGPFPTELTGPVSDELRNKGQEFGSTTGRPRRCGWLDIPALNYAILINGVTELAITKMDVLSRMGELNVCTRYYYSNGTLSDTAPCESNLQSDPVYTGLPEWEYLCDRSTGKLTPNALEYIEFIEAGIGMPVKYISTGPGREEILIRNKKKK